MTNEIDVLNRLWNWADESENVRAIVFNGSRGDPSRTPDPLSDYDVAVIVRDLNQVINESWLEQFDPVMVRWPLKPQSTFDPAWITQLVLFKDGVRIDFQFTLEESGCAVERPADYFCTLIDKNRLSEHLMPAAPVGRSLEPPSAEEFADRINAFWWDIPYVAKALRRGEINYARFVLESDIRFQKLLPLLSWHIGIRCNWQTDIGVSGRWLERYLEPEVWRSYLDTFSGADIGENWRAMFATMDLVREIGHDVAENMGFAYPHAVDTGVTDYIEGIRRSDSAKPG